MWAGPRPAYIWGVGGHIGWHSDNAPPLRVLDVLGAAVSALSLAAFALLGLSTTAAAAPPSVQTGDWEISYDYYSTELDAMSPYWEATLHTGGDLELTVLGFPMMGLVLPTSVWGTWREKKGGKRIVLQPDRFTKLTGKHIGDGCYAGTITYTDSQGSMSGVWEGCPL
jgi:hypothetical protein